MVIMELNLSMLKDDVSPAFYTPFDVTRHMVDLSLEKIEISDDSIPEDLVICDLAVGAGLSYYSTLE